MWNILFYCFAWYKHREEVKKEKHIEGEKTKPKTQSTRLWMIIHCYRIIIQRSKRRIDKSTVTNFSTFLPNGRRIIIFFLVYLTLASGDIFGFFFFCILFTGLYSLRTNSIIFLNAFEFIILLFNTMNSLNLWLFFLLKEYLLHISISEYPF